MKRELSARCVLLTSLMPNSFLFTFVSAQKDTHGPPYPMFKGGRSVLEAVMIISGLFLCIDLFALVLTSQVLNNGNSE